MAEYILGRGKKIKFDMDHDVHKIYRYKITRLLGFDLVLHAWKRKIEGKNMIQAGRRKGLQQTPNLYHDC